MRFCAENAIGTLEGVWKLGCLVVQLDVFEIVAVNNVELHACAIDMPLDSANRYCQDVRDFICGLSRFHEVYNLSFASRKR